MGAGAFSESAQCCEWCSDRNRDLLLLWENCEIAGPLIVQEITPLRDSRCTLCSDDLGLDCSY